MSRTCEKCIHYDICRYPLEYRAFPDTCWKYEEESPHGEWVEIKTEYGTTYLGCSNCSWENEHRLTHWVACPNCGADMRG